MSNLLRPSISRRQAIAALIASLSVARADSTIAQSSTPVATPASPIVPTDLGSGLSVVDYRLFPSPDVMRFIAEIKNSTDEIVFAPSVGVIVPELPLEGGYGWGTPFTPLIHPQSSTFVIGVAPTGLADDSRWGSPEWIDCGTTESDRQQLDNIANASVEIDLQTEVVDPEFLKLSISLTNRAESMLDRAKLQGIVRDSDGRIAGGIPTSNVRKFAPGEKREQTLNLRPTIDYPANPFALIRDVTGCTVELSLQPYSKPVNDACPIVMPWNR